MNKIERLEAAIAGKEVDRVPYSIWYHLSAVDQDPVSLAEETVALSKKYDYDFVKMMPFGLYGVQDLGAKINIFAQQGKPPLVARPGIQSISDYLAFSNRSYFYTCFQKMTGMSPSEYRNAYRK